MPTSTTGTVPTSLAQDITCEQAPDWVIRRRKNILAERAESGLGRKKMAWEPIDILLIPPIHDTRIWHIADC